MHLGQSVEDLFDTLGHDGSAIVDSSASEPWCRRAFHERELIDLAYTYKHWLIRVDRHLERPPIQQYNDQQFFDYIVNYNTIICGTFPTRHAVACDKNQVFDPRGFVAPASSFIGKWHDAIDSIYVIKSF